jgi:four helix bundle protein
MSDGRLEDYGAYRKALELLDLVVADINAHLRAPECRRLVSQHLASADSICSNMEEGYGRLSQKEYVRFLVISRGSAQDTRGRYKRLRHWLPSEAVSQRVSLAGEIIAILTASIQTLREGS